MNETQVKNELRSKLKDRGASVVRFEDRFRSGLPDCLVGKMGRCAFVEVKLSGTGKNSLYEPWTWPAYKMGQCLLIQELSKFSGVRAFYLVYDPEFKRSLIALVSIVVEASRKRIPINAGFVDKGYQDENLLLLIERK